MPGVALAAAFVVTIAWAVAQDDGGGGGDDEDAKAVVVVPTSISSEGVALPAREELPEATLTVHDDGCGVIRSELSPEPDNLTWVVKDLDGFQVLGRNALGETQYRYFQPGTYTVVLEAWEVDRYVEISKTVRISC
ncbi:MAG: hypothetical protein ACSLFP_12610 [Acidimicrobiales bacterium]